jgi:hypothetical protein
MKIVAPGERANCGGCCRSRGSSSVRIFAKVRRPCFASAFVGGAADVLGVPDVLGVADGARLGVISPVTAPEPRGEGLELAAGADDGRSTRPTTPMATRITVAATASVTAGRRRRLTRDDPLLSNRIQSRRVSFS